jgi:hypothetical protein
VLDDPPLAHDVVELARRIETSELGRKAGAALARRAAGQNDKTKPTEKRPAISVKRVCMYFGRTNPIRTRATAAPV